MNLYYIDFGIIKLCNIHIMDSIQSFRNIKNNIIFLKWFTIRKHIVVKENVIISFTHFY